MYSFLLHTTTLVPLSGLHNITKSWLLRKDLMAANSSSARLLFRFFDFERKKQPYICCTDLLTFVFPIQK